METCPLHLAHAAARLFGLFMDPAYWHVSISGLTLTLFWQWPGQAKSTCQSRAAAIAIAIAIANAGQIAAMRFAKTNGKLHIL